MFDKTRKRVRTLIRMVVTHCLAVVLGFGLGVYYLPILTAAPAPDQAVLEEAAENASFTGEFTRELAGSDFLHWGEGTIAVSNTQITHIGEMSPGPDYKLYLVPEFVEDEAGFEAIKNQSLQLGDIKGFKGFTLPVPVGTDIEAYTTVLIWCEAFGEFITAAKYR